MKKTIIICFVLLFFIFAAVDCTNEQFLHSSTRTSVSCSDKYTNGNELKKILHSITTCSGCPLISAVKNNDMTKARYQRLSTIDHSLAMEPISLEDLGRGVKKNSYESNNVSSSKSHFILSIVPLQLPIQDYYIVGIGGLVPLICILIWCFSKTNVARFTYPIGIFLLNALGIFLFCEGVVTVSIPFPRNIIFGKVYTYGIWKATRLVSSHAVAACNCLVKTILVFITLTFVFNILTRIRLRKIESCFLNDCNIPTYMDRISGIIHRAQRRMESKNIIAIRTQYYYCIALFQQSKIDEAIRLAESLSTLEILETAKAMPIKAMLCIFRSSMYDAIGECEKAKLTFIEGKSALCKCRGRSKQTIAWLKTTQMDIYAREKYLAGDYKEAVSIWEQMLPAAQLGYSQALLCCYLAKCYHKLGENDRALQHYFQARNIAPDFYSTQSAKIDAGICDS